MSTEQNKALDVRLFEETLNKGDMAVIDEIIAADYVAHDPTGPEIRGPVGLKQYVRVYRAAFPDLQITVEDQIAEGDKVVTRWTARGTHTGDLRGIPPTGKQATVTGITITHYASGKAVEGWVNWDTLGLMQQLSVIPMPDAGNRQAWG